MLDKATRAILSIDYHMAVRISYGKMKKIN